jgi:transcriptional regulator with XRE-family HTH domain
MAIAMIYIGKTARYLRERKGMTQAAVAEALGITQVHLSNVENCKAFPSPKLLERYRALWGVDLYILGWSLFGDPAKLPPAVRGPMEALGRAWRIELGDLIPDVEGADLA